MKLRCNCKPGFSGIYCDEVDMCVTEKLCQPNGVCIKVKSSRLGHTYKSNCRFGYKNDPTTFPPDCTINLKVFDWLKISLKAVKTDHVSGTFRLQRLHSAFRLLHSDWLLSSLNPIGGLRLQIRKEENECIRRSNISILFR